MKAVFWIRIRIKKCLLDLDPHGKMLIRNQELKKFRKCTGSLGEHITGRIKVSMYPFVILKFILNFLIFNDFFYVILKDLVENLLV